jgi:hypothetical protein
MGGGSIRKTLPSQEDLSAQTLSPFLPPILSPPPPISGTPPLSLPNLVLLLGPHV